MNDSNQIGKIFNGWQKSIKHILGKPERDIALSFSHTHTHTQRQIPLVNIDTKILYKTLAN